MTLAAQRVPGGQAAHATSSLAVFCFGTGCISAAVPPGVIVAVAVRGVPRACRRHSSARIAGSRIVIKGIAPVAHRRRRARGDYDRRKPNQRPAQAVHTLNGRERQRGREAERETERQTDLVLEWEQFKPTVTLGPPVALYSSREKYAEPTVACSVVQAPPVGLHAGGTVGNTTVQIGSSCFPCSNAAAAA